MKAKIFIGSSVEGLGIAYAIQQNLIHNAEVTVWDQGVFELSATTIESLEKVLEKSDFGIFVFSPDDIAKIRKNEFSIVRDNVIIEYGLFVGKLGRERVFFVKPMNQDLHLPTDLMGITPGNYEANREDKSLQAGTGAFCNQVRQKIIKLGKLQHNEQIGKASEEEESKTSKNNKWRNDFYLKKYKEAKDKLEKLLKEQTEEKRIIDHKGWIAYCVFKINEKKGIESLEKILAEFPKNSHSYTVFAKVLLKEDYFDKSLEIIEAGIKAFPEEKNLKLLKSDCIKNFSDSKECIKYLKSVNSDNDVDIAIKIIDTYREEKQFIEARDEVHKIYQEFPNNKHIKYRYARIADELEEYEISFYFLVSLTNSYPDNSNYWGYLSNTCIQLDFYDLALTANRKAQKLTDSKEEWILSNIANMLNNKGFYTESIEYFEKALKIDSESEFAHDRMATAIKLRQEEREEIQASTKEGKKRIRDYIIKK